MTVLLFCLVNYLFYSNILFFFLSLVVSIGVDLFAVAWYRHRELELRNFLLITSRLYILQNGLAGFSSGGGDLLS